MDLDHDLKEELLRLIKEGKPLPVSYKNLIFPPEKIPKEYELVFGIKEREEDILADTMSVPFQPVKRFGKVKEGEWHNQLIFGDNLQALKHIKKLQDKGNMEKIKLVFIDPPFGTGDIYDAKGVPAYSAALQGAEFLEFLRKRLILLKDILADNGSIYVRLDYHFGHYIKILMDEIFDKNNFQSELIINRFKKKSDAYTTTTESLFFYSKSPNFIFNKIEKPRECTFCKQEIKPKWQWMTSAGESRLARYFLIDGKKVLLYPPRGRHWTNGQEKIDELYKENKIRINSKSSYTDVNGKKVNFVPERLQEEDTEIDNNWTDIPGYVFGVFTEGTYGIKYPTQNAEEVLERVIKASSNPGDLILDCFAGSGTTGAVAEKLGRRWIMVDCGKLAIYTMIKRLHSLKEEIGNSGKPLKPKPFVLYNAGLYEDHEFILKVGEDQYKKFALECFQVEPTDVEINGLKMDGVLLNCYVKVFSQKGYLTEAYIDELHDTVGESIKSRMFIIAPASRVYFLQDYIEKEGIRYYILRIPYSVIDEIHKKMFTRTFQPTSQKGIIEPDISMATQTGFDFIHPPKVKAAYYKIKPKNKLSGFTGGEELIIELKSFEVVQRSKEPMEFKDPKEALSMVFVDRNYNGEFFNMTDYFFGDDIKKQDYKINISEETGDRIMIIYLDVLGNESIEVKKISDFKKK